MTRGEVWWADMPEPLRSEPEFRRPVIVVQADMFTRSKLNTVVCVVLTSNLRLADSPGNVLLPMKLTGLGRDSVANVSQLITADRTFLVEKIGDLPGRVMQAIDDGLRLVLAL